MFIELKPETKLKIIGWIAILAALIGMIVLTGCATTQTATIQLPKVEYSEE